MELFDKIQSYLNTLETKRLYQYIGGLLGFISLIMFAVIFQYYRTVSSLKSEIISINESREEIRTILDKGQQVKKEQKEIDAILAQDENFKIKGNFGDLIEKLGLSNKKISIEVSSRAREGRYQERILLARFAGMTMKELTELLQEIEFNKRVFTKELDITVAKKVPGTIDVGLTIAALEPKPKEEADTSE